MTSTDDLVAAAKELARRTGALRFAPPVAFVYHPLEYAWAPHELYLRKHGGGKKRIVFLGMNPGPFGMAQTGVPFGEVKAVRDWIGVCAPVGKPPREHPKRPVQGFACPRSEVSGRRLWGCFAEKFGTAEHFFRDHFVVNYCPLLFMEEGGRNLTPDKFTGPVTAELYAACDEHLRKVVECQRPEWVIGVGGFAETRAREALGEKVSIGRIPHPSPANPQANKDWAGAATRALKKLGAWA